jgi:hypothetical protein
MPNKAAHPPRWFSAWRTAARPVQGVDPADQGTAFGLDMSMAETAPESAPPGERRAGWVRRLADRRRSAT